MEAIVEVLYESPTGGKVIRSPKTLGGKPRLPGRRLSVIHVAEPVIEHDTTIEEMQRRFSPDEPLPWEDVVAAITYYQDNPEIIERIERRSSEIQAVLQHRVLVCECGAEFTSPSRTHFESEEHVIVKTYFTHQIECSCGAEFDEPMDFLHHQGELEGDVMSVDTHQLANIEY